MAWSRSRSRSSSRDYYSPWPEYVPVAERRAKAAAQVLKMAKKGHQVAPVKIEGRAIATTVWGKAWCAALEAQADLSNRLPRGRSYARNGSIIDLQASGRTVTALVSGSAVYHIKIELAPLPAARWQKAVSACSGKIGSLIELLQGKVSKEVMAVMSDPRDGIFPQGGDLKMSCSCPDGAWMCKHLAAVLYGIGNRLDSQPEQIFALRGVDPSELVAAASTLKPTAAAGHHKLLDGDLADIFGVDLDAEPSPASLAPPSSFLAPASHVRSRAAPSKAARASTSRSPRKAASSGASLSGASLQSPPGPVARSTASKAKAPAPRASAKPVELVAEAARPSAPTKAKPAKKVAAKPPKKAAAKPAKKAAAKPAKKAAAKVTKTAVKPKKAASKAKASKFDWRFLARGPHPRPLSRPRERGAHPAEKPPCAPPFPL